ncbi:MAG: hypothetical protein AAFU64_08405, partial [Bacteroidota bacterium]
KRIQVCRFTLIFKKICFFCLAGLLLSCEAYTHREGDQEDVDFSTNDASELFFHNVRQIYYDIENQEATKLKLYRKKNRIQAEDQPMINLVIVENWRYDEAYLLIEPSFAPGSSRQILVYWESKAPQESGSYTFKFGNKSSHFHFAKQLYDSILKSDRLFLDQEGQKLPIFATSQEKDSFRVMMEDYLRLIGEF